MDLIIVWLVVIISTLLIEVITINLGTICFTFGGVAAIIFYSLGFSLTIQLVAFIIVSGLCFVLLKPMAKKALTRKRVKTNADSVIGEIAVVTETIKNNKQGAVKVQGKEWTAITKDENITFKIGSEVRVIAIKGVKLLVQNKRREK